MEEVFRFSVVRAVTKSQPALLRLANAPPRPVIGKLGAGSAFQSGIQTQIAQLLAAGETPQSLWQRLEPIAAQYAVANGPAILGNPLWSTLESFLDGLTALSTQTPPPAMLDQAAIQAVFDQFQALTAASVAAYNSVLADFYLALLIVRRGGPSALDVMARGNNLVTFISLLGSSPSLPDIARRLAACAVFVEGAAALVPPAADSVTAAQSALASTLASAVNATVIIPPAILQPLPKPVLGVGFRELQVVKQNIRRYEAAEIGRIENILKGESRDHIQRHTLSTETDTTESTSTTTETDKELTTDDHTDIKNETQNQVNTDTKLDAGVHAQYSGPSYKLQADLNVSYSNSDQTTKQYSSDTAKDVTQKAATKVTEVISRTQTTKIIEAFYDTERQSFNNAQGAANISGIYQWIEKVYLCQVFNLGRHMLIDITVPEPGANLLALATSTPNQDPPPIQPHPLGTILSDANGKPILDNYGRLQLDKPLNPLDLSPSSQDTNFYGKWVAYYGATGVTPPPDTQRTSSKGETFDYKDDNDKSVADQMQVDDGYAAISVNVSVSAMRNDNPGQPYSDNVYIDVAVGGAAVHIPWFNTQRSNTLFGAAVLNPPVTGTVNFTIYGRNIDQMSVNIELVCSPEQSLIDQWKLQTYEKIVDAYNDLQQTYNAAIAARKLAAQSVGPLGAEDPDANRETERVELKRSCIAIFDNNNATVRGTDPAVTLWQAPGAPVFPIPPDPTQPQLPEPILDTSQSLGARVRWFEQAFEWENMAYVLYPYFWGRRSRWVSDLSLTNDDPLFLSFLTAGYARVVVPVRLGFETAVQFYLNSGLPWLGGDLPPVGDDTQNPLYLDVAEEIKNLTGGGYSGEIEVPVGDPWEYVLPTTLMKLRDDDSLPEWSRVIPAGISPDNPLYASNAPDGPWTWVDGPPSENASVPVAAQATTTAVPVASPSVKLRKSVAPTKAKRRMSKN